MTTRLTTTANCFVLTLLFISAADGHEGHHHADDSSHFTVITADTDGQKFETKTHAYRWKHRNDLGIQPEAMVSAARGGLHNNADIDPVSGELVTVIRNYGLVALDADLKAWSLVKEQDPLFSEGMNSHGMDCFQIDDQVFYAASSTNTREVVISNRGKVVARLSAPKGDEFDNPTVNEYYAGGGAFVPCDAVWLPVAKRLIVVTGYSPGDYAISASLIDGTWQWSGPAFGGKEAKGGPFNTAHGIEVKQVADQETIEVASRGHGRIYGFTPSGAMIKTEGSDKDYYVQLPSQSTPCNLSFLDDQSFIPLLNSIPDIEGFAPVLVMQNNRLIGSLVPSRFDGLEYMHHMHGFKAFERDGKLFGVALSWPDGNRNSRNDGQIAIFEAALDGKAE